MGAEPTPEEIEQRCREVGNITWYAVGARVVHAEHYSGAASIHAEVLKDTLSELSGVFCP